LGISGEQSGGERVNCLKKRVFIVVVAGGEKTKREKKHCRGGWGPNRSCGEPKPERRGVVVVAGHTAERERGESCGE